MATILFSDPARDFLRFCGMTPGDLARILQLLGDVECKVSTITVSPEGQVRVVGMVTDKAQNLRYRIESTGPRSEPGASEISETPPFSPFPRILSLFKFVLDHRTQERVFAPGFEELCVDHLKARQEARSSLGRSWLRFCFGFRTVLFFTVCLAGTLRFWSLSLLRSVAGIDLLYEWWIQLGGRRRDDGD